MIETTNPYYCPLCGSLHVIMWEWQGAYDGWMALKCNDCDKMSHRFTRTEVVSAVQREDYGPVDFVLKDGRKFVNLYPDENDFMSRIAGTKQPETETL